MKTVIRNFFFSLPLGSRLLLLAYALGFPITKAGLYGHWFNLYDWLALDPDAVWHGQVWRMVTYAFLAAGILDWVISFFWMATLVAVLGKHWSGGKLWTF